MIRTGITTLLAVAILAALPADTHAQVKKSDSVVKVEVAAGKIENDKQTVTLTLIIEKEWHLYAHEIGQENLAIAAEVTISGQTKPQTVKISYPPGKLKEDNAVGDHYIYEGKAVIQANVQRVKGDTGPLKATIKLQACSSGESATCLPASTVEVNIP
jgi:thiol:disulfide interchange protein